jgi:hypothetical protein
MLLILLQVLACGEALPELPPQNLKQPPKGRIVKYSSVRLYLLKASRNPERIFLIKGSPTDQVLQRCAKEHWSPTSHVGISENSAAEINDYLNGMDKEIAPLTLEHILCRQ